MDTYQVNLISKELGGNKKTRSAYFSNSVLSNVDDIRNKSIKLCIKKGTLGLE